MLHKNWRDGGELLLKTVQYIVTPTNHVIARAGFTLSWAPGTLGFSQYFLPNTGKDQKKVLSERGVPGTVSYVKSVLGYSITFTKRLDEGLSWQLFG